MNCPTCKGKGKVTVKVTTVAPGTANTHSEFEMNCLTCRGEGEISKAQAQEHKAAMAMWCRCGNPSGQTHFFDDGENPAVCNKHHWVCEDCGKVTQVG